MGCRITDADHGTFNSAGISINAKFLVIRFKSSRMKNLIKPTVLISLLLSKIDFEKRNIKIAVQSAKKIAEKAASSAANKVSE